MKHIFMSASVPLPTRNKKYFNTADVFLIRDAVKALVEVILPVGTITFGGHPAITPLISLYVKNENLDKNHVSLFMSEFFLGKFPREHSDFININYTKKRNTRFESLELMRSEMLSSRKFDAAVLIGGMEGISDEAQLFSKKHPKAKILPLPSTGAAALEYFNAHNFDKSLLKEISFASLFRRKLL